MSDQFRGLEMITCDDCGNCVAAMNLDMHKVRECQRNAKMTSTCKAGADTCTANIGKESNQSATAALPNKENCSTSSCSLFQNKVEISPSPYAPCQGCHQLIPKGVIRYAIAYQSDGYQYYHAQCCPETLSATIHNPYQEHKETTLPSTCEGNEDDDDDDDDCVVVTGPTSSLKRKFDEALANGDIVVIDD